ncbi:FAD-dependent oxidoreductase [Methanoculleus sp. 7T]|uniref:FAD-dependent oxidoreductase n=1 Tax=Methanoculleus sp. 7T TaxID=2937282 RepID=UPI0020BE0BAA|nr:FAD-dependent oxidoreductase [Methanoculleus sp. 7T]MCK8519579.1 FAD-dependent oxidoreductase [Methanoculleus sp. 7T]
MGESPERNGGLPGKAESYWVDTSPETGFPPLDGDGRVDVTVIGGGIAGITTAFLLKRAGLTVALLDAYRIVKGATGYTTAKVTSLHRLIYADLIDRFGSAKAKQYADANQAAIEMIASIVREYNIPCDFERKPAYTYAESAESRDLVAAEADAAKSLGLPATFTDDVPLPGRAHGAVVLENQAQFHPRNYLLLLAGHLPGEGSYIFERTRAVGVEEQTDGVRVTTDWGSLYSDYAVLATHYPIYDRPGSYFSRMRASRSYALGLRIDEPFPNGIFINAAGAVHSWRSQPAGGGELVIVTGAAHDTGKAADTREHYRRLADYARSVYPVRSIDYHWSAQDYITADRVPYIGRLAEGHDRVFVATGFGKWGMAAGTAAGMILADLIRDRASPWAEVFDPARFKEQPEYPDWVRNKLQSAGRPFEVEAARFDREVAAIPHGEGRVVEINEQKVAVYRDEHGAVRTLDPTCMHMACTVAWNNAEKSWDCPCHGSRYDAYGRVIESPTVKDLKEKEVVRR